MSERCVAGEEIDPFLAMAGWLHVGLRREARRTYLQTASSGSGIDARALAAGSSGLLSGLRRLVLDRCPRPSRRTLLRLGVRQEPQHVEARSTGGGGLGRFPGPRMPAGGISPRPEAMA